MNTVERRQKILEMINIRKRITVPELSVALNVSERTIYRDIVFLSDKSKLYTIPGRTGGVFVLPLRRDDDKPKFTSADLAVLIKLQSAANQRICSLNSSELIALQKIITLGANYLA